MNNFQVADCVCLMSLDKPGVIPVDTHVWQIAARNYIPKLKVSKSLTDNLYKEIGSYKCLFQLSTGFFILILMVFL